MGEHAMIGRDGSISITTSAWLGRRIGKPQAALTADLRIWAEMAHYQDAIRSLRLERDLHKSAGPHPHLGNKPRWQRGAMDWCRDHDDALDDSSVIMLSGTRLDSRLWIIRLTHPQHGRLVVVSIDFCLPTVFTDLCTDTLRWYDADSVDILCPTGHRWTWRAGREVITSRGAASTLTLVFGPDLDAPFTPCPHCTTARASGKCGCGCDGTPWILCPTCGRRCDVDLPR